MLVGGHATSNERCTAESVVEDVEEDLAVGRFGEVRDAALEPGAYELHSERVGGEQAMPGGVVDALLRSNAGQEVWRSSARLRRSASGSASSTAAQRWLLGRTDVLIALACCYW